MLADGKREEANARGLETQEKANARRLETRKEASAHRPELQEKRAPEPQGRSTRGLKPQEETSTSQTGAAEDKRSRSETPGGDEEEPGVHSLHNIS